LVAFRPVRDLLLCAKEEEWKLTHDGAPVAILRPWLGCYYVYLSDQSHERPLGPFRSMLEAIRHVQPSKRSTAAWFICAAR
jgi:hypothetical protein